MAVRNPASVADDLPMERLYHASDTEFDEFNRQGDRLTSLGLGNYLTPNKSKASQYGDIVMDFDVDTRNILDWGNLSDTQRNTIKTRLIGSVPDDRLRGFSGVKYEAIPRNSDGEKRFRELQAATKDYYHDRAKAVIVDSDQLPKGMKKESDLYIRYAENQTNLDNATDANLLSLAQEYDHEIARGLGYKGARFGDEVAIYDKSLAKRARKVADDLPMDEASRMARAQEGGFGDDLYHATGGDDWSEYDASKMNRTWLGRGMHMSKSPEGANRYANQWLKPGDPQSARVMPVVTKAKNPADEATYKRIYNEILEDNPNNIDTRFGSPELDKAIVDRLRADGYDSISYHDQFSGDVLVALNPQDVRSKFAKFDPSKKNSANLLAGGAAAAIGLNALTRPERDEYVTR